MKGIDIATVRYAIFKQSALANVSTDNYPAVIEEFGHDLKEEYLPYINGNGFAILFTGESGVTPETTYVFMATATNTVGDQSHQMGFGDHQRGSGRRPGEGAGRNPNGRTAPVARRETHRQPREVHLPDGERPAARRSETRRRPLDHHSQHAQHQIRVHL